jgi:hypothetical protein
MGRLPARMHSLHHRVDYCKMEQGWYRTPPSVTVSKGAL